MKLDDRSATPRVDATARTELANVLDRPGIVAGLLFGSHATGAAGPLSDVDIAVWLDPELAPQERVALRDELLAATIDVVESDAVDVVILNDAPPALVHRALRYGLRMVERDRDNRVRFETAALLAYFDTQPLRDTLADGRRRRLDEDRFGRR